MKKIIVFGVIIVIAVGVVLIIIHDNHVKQQNALNTANCVAQNEAYYSPIIKDDETNPSLNSQLGQTLQAEQAANSQCGK
jgi:hypothetical protein